MKRPLLLLLLSQLAHPLVVGSGSGTRGAVEAQGGGTVLHQAIFANVVSSQLGCTCAVSACFLRALIPNGLNRPSVRPVVVVFFFVFPAGMFFGPRSSPFLVDLFHFAVPVDALVVAALFLALSERGRGLNDESPVLGDRVA